VVDVGGGNGQNLTAILKRHPSLHGILFDLPAVVERARARIEALGLSDRCRIQGGDFFSAVPPGADAYVLRHIIHDWQDKEAIAILRNCRLAANPGGKVLVVETVIPPGNEPSFGKWLDLMMLLVDGRQRTEADYNRLFSGAGLKLNRIVPTAAGVSIIEGVNPKD
jgi:ubiquinone/menaquinone biosynthesis C-methylase UbiE